MNTVDTELHREINKKPINAKNIMAFLKLGANPNLCDANGVPLLLVLCHEKKKKEMFTLIDKYKVNVSTINPVTKLTVLETIYHHTPSISNEFNRDDITRLLAAGANINSILPDGRPLFYQILARIPANSLSWAIATLKTYRPDVHTRYQTTGKTLVEMMLERSDVSMEIHMELVRLGGNPTSRNTKGESLLSMLVDGEKDDLITELKGYIDTYENARAPHLETPRELTFIEKGRVLFLELTHPAMTKNIARDFASSWKHQGHNYTSKNKEMVIAYIESLPAEEKMAALKLALEKGSPYQSNSGAPLTSSTNDATNLNVFFSKARGISMTQYNSGSFKRLFAMHDELWLAEAYAREERGEAPVEPDFPIINRQGLIDYIRSLSWDHQKIMLDMASNQNVDGNNINRSFLIKSNGKYLTHLHCHDILNRIRATGPEKDLIPNFESKSKEAVINEIALLPHAQKQLALTDSLKTGGRLNRFFDTQRGPLPTSQSRGSFKKLNDMQKQLISESAEYTLRA